MMFEVFWFLASTVQFVEWETVRQNRSRTVSYRTRNYVMWLDELLAGKFPPK